MKLSTCIIGAVAVAACLFVPYEDWTIYESDVTGSSTKVNHWFWVFDTREITPSPLRQWCEKHNVPVQEKDKFLAHDTFSIFCSSYACGAGSIARSFYHELQEIYVRYESEGAIRAYISAMMAAPDAATRGKLVGAAVARAKELEKTNRQT